MERRHLQKTDISYKVFLYIFYLSSAIMVSITVFGIIITLDEWEKNGTYVMGEKIHNTVIPFENFARLTTWLFFSSIISWYCVTRIGWKRTAGDKIKGVRMPLLQLMLLGFTIICLYEVLYNFTILNAQITAGIIDGLRFRFSHHTSARRPVRSPKHRAVFPATSSATASNDMPRTSATRCAISDTYWGSLRRPRWGTGAR